MTRLPNRVHEYLQNTTTDLKIYQLDMEAAGLARDGEDWERLHHIHVSLLVILEWSSGGCSAKELNHEREDPCTKP